jgi:hypothetical protein
VTFPLHDLLGDADERPEGCRQQEHRYQEVKFTPADIKKASP